MPGALTDLAEGHGMERSKRLPGGANGTNYTIQVQFAVVNPQSVFTLDDWHLAVHTNLYRGSTCRTRPSAAPLRGRGPVAAARWSPPATVVGGRRSPYAGAFGLAAVSDSVSSTDALVFLVGSGFAAAAYEYGLARLTRSVLRRRA